MICKGCKKKLTPIDLYCLNCGVPTDSYKQHFNVKGILKKASEKAEAQKSNFYFYYIGIMLVLLFVVYLANFGVISDVYLFNYIFLNVALVFIVPLLLLPFATITDSANELIKLSETFKFYPKLVLFVFGVVLYFALLKLVCQGDPILNIVRFIMVLWGVAVAFPIPFLIFKKSDVPSFAPNGKSHPTSSNDDTSLRSGGACLHPTWRRTSLQRAFIAGKYLRWQQFALCFVLFVLNLGSVLLLLIPLPSAMHYTGNVMYIWHKKQAEFALYDKNKDY